MKGVCITLLAILCFISSATAADQMTLSSPQIKPGVKIDQQQVYKGFGCSGQDISPVLKWDGAPAGTKSFALTVYDPDAPTGSGWWHWVIFNIPADVHELKENAGNSSSGPAPQGSVQSLNDYGKMGYGGPCPPQGAKAHHYIFTLYALDTAKIELGKDAMPAMVGFMLHQHALAKATLTGLYSR